ncbi:unnamed protein product, partial [Closterium sp. NIES-53]
FDTWLDDLQLYLLNDSRDSVLLFDHTSGASLAPPATADSATRSQWLTRDAAARLAVRNHLSLAERAHFGQHKTAKALYDAVVAFDDLITQLRTSNARYCTALPTEFLDRNPPPMYITLYFIVTRLLDSLRAARDHSLALDPTDLTVDLLEKHLLAAETRVVTVGAARGSLPETSPKLRWTGEVGDASLPLPLYSSPAPAALPCSRSPCGASRVAASWGAEPRGAGSEGAGCGGAEPGGEEPRGAEPAGVEPEGVEQGGAALEGAESGGAEPQGACWSGGPAGASPRLSAQQLREWFVWRAHRRSGATRAGGAGDAGAGGSGVTAGPRGARTRGTRAAGTSGVEGAGAGDPTETGATRAGGAGAGSAGARGAEAAGAGAVDPGAGGAGDTVRPRPYFVPLLKQVLGVPSSPSLNPPLLCPPPDQSHQTLPPASPLPALSPYTEHSGGLTKRREPASRPVLPVRTARRIPRSCPPPVPGRHAMTLRPSSVPLRVPLPAPPESSLPEVPDPECTRSFNASASSSPRHSPLCLPSTRSQLHLRMSPTSGMRLVLGGQGPVVLTGLADASWELRWLTYLLTDFGEQPHSPPVLYVDNKAMIALCQNHRLEHRTKHIALRYFLARELQQRGQLCLVYMATRANTADIFTKALPPGDHQRFSTVLGILALLFLTGLVTTCSPPFGLWGPLVGPALGPRGPERPHPERAARPEQPEPSRPNRAAPPYLNRAAPPYLNRAEACTGPSRPTYLWGAPTVFPPTAAITLTTPMASPPVLAFDAEGRPVKFDTWLHDLHLFLQLTAKEDISLYDHALGHATAPATTADSTARSQWQTRDAHARFAIRNSLPIDEREHFGQHKTAQALYTAVVARYSSPASAALGRLSLPYLFPDLASFHTVADLITHLRTSEARFRAAMPDEFLAKNPPPLWLTLYHLVTRLPDNLRSVRDHFLARCPTELTIAFLEKELLAAEASIVAVGASRGDPSTPFFEGCSPSPLLPSVASTAAVDLLSAEKVGTASASSGRRSGKGKGGKGGGGDSGGGGGVVTSASEAVPLCLIHAAAPHFLWPFAVRYAAHQLNLWPRVSLPETSPTLLWTGEVSDASRFRVWGSRAFVRDTSADKLSSRAVPCVFLGFVPDAPGWQFYHATLRRVLPSQDVTFDESVPYYRLFPYRTAPLPPPPLFLAPGAAVVDPLPPQGAAPSGVSQVDLVEPVEVAVDSRPAAGVEPGGAEPGGADSGGAEPGGAESGGTELGGAECGGTEPWGAETRSPEPGGPESGGPVPESPTPRGALSSAQLREWYLQYCSLRSGTSGARRPIGAGACASPPRRELPSRDQIREWYERRCTLRSGAPGVTDPGAAGAAAGATGPGVGAAPCTADPGVGATAGAEDPGVGATTGAEDPGAGATAGTLESGVGAAAGAGDPGIGDATGAEDSGVGAAAGPEDPGTGDSAGPGVAARRRPYFVLLLQQVLGPPPSPGPSPPSACPQPVQSQLELRPASPLPAPSPYTGPTGGLAERREPASRPVSPVRPARTSGCGSRQRPPPVPGTHRMSLRPSTAPLRAPFPSPPESPFLALADPASDSLRCASPTVARLLSTVVTDPSFGSTAASALVAELVNFAAHYRLDYAARLVAESASVCPPSVGGECALGTDVLEDRQEEFQCLAAASPHLVSVLLTPEGDPDALDIPTPRSYAEAIEGTYVDAVPPPGANIVSGMWIFRVKRPPGSPPVFKARYVARGFRQRQAVDYFQTFSPTPKMTTLRVLLHVAAHRDYELHSLDFSTAFLKGSLHEEIWLRRPHGFTGTFPPGTQWSLRRPVYGLRQAPREWHDTLRTTLAALGFAPSTADPSLFLRTDTSLPLFYILVYITRDRARRTITLTQSHMVQQVLQRFGFMYSSPQATPLPTRHSLSALPSDESVELSGPYPELVGCLMYLMTCTRPDLAYPLSILARYVAPGRHRPEHMAAAKRVLRYLCSTSGMGLVLGGRSPVVLTGHADASWADDQATQRSCEAEIYAGAMAAQELRWLTYLLTDLGEPPRSPPVLYVDNKAMLALCREQRLEHITHCSPLLPCS